MAGSRGGGGGGGDWVTGSATFEEAVAEELAELGDAIYFLDDGGDVVFESDELDTVIVEDAIGGAGVAVTGLSDGADVDDGFFALAEFVGVVEFIGGVEVGFVGEHALGVGVALLLILRG